MCLPTDTDELRRIELMGRTMDVVFDALFKPRHPQECEQCGNIYIPRMTDGHYVCQECRDENASAQDEADAARVMRGSREDYYGS